MPMDKNEFFKEASLRICSSLDFGQALEQVRLYLSQRLPLDGLFLNLYEKEKKAIRTIVCSTAASGPRKNILVPLNAQAVEFMEESYGFSDRVIKYLKHPSENIMGLLEAPILGYEDRALIAMRLQIDGQTLGVLIASAKPEAVFSAGHLDLIECLHKPFSLALNNALTHEKMVGLKDLLAEENRFLIQELTTSQDHFIIGAKGGLKNVMDMVGQVAPLNNTVLILGETGTGKEVVANAIHHASPRSAGPFIKVNCGAIPENLIDTELFGHEKGAFTGATNRKRGRFERAHGGTVFLDEIGELPMAAQIRLLRVLQTREIERVGGTKMIPVDIRVIAATHRNLEQMITKNIFREDLWYRLNVFPIIIPPLRQRRADIPLLIQHFIEKKSREMGLRTPPEVAEGVHRQLIEYAWPGNVRELENVVERAMIQNRGRTLPLTPYVLMPTVDNPVSEVSEEFKCVFPCPAKQRGGDNLKKAANGCPLTLDETIASQINETLKLTKGKVGGPEGAAAVLGLNPSTLRNRMNKLGIAYGKQAANR